MVMWGFELPPHEIALHLGHEDDGRLVREAYWHPDAAMARERTCQGGPVGRAGCNAPGVMP